MPTVLGAVEGVALVAVEDGRFATTSLNGCAFAFAVCATADAAPGALVAIVICMYCTMKMKEWTSRGQFVGTNNGR